MNVHVIDIKDCFLGLGQNGFALGVCVHERGGEGEGERDGREGNMHAKLMGER